MGGDQFASAEALDALRQQPVLLALAPNLAIQARAGKRPEAERQSNGACLNPTCASGDTSAKRRSANSAAAPLARYLTGQLAPCGQLPDLQVRPPGVVAIEIQAFAFG